MSSSKADSVVDGKWVNLVINPKDSTEAFTLSYDTGTLVRVNLTTGDFTRIGNSNADSVVHEHRWAGFALNPKDPTEAFALSAVTGTRY